MRNIFCTGIMCTIFSFCSFAMETSKLSIDHSQPNSLAHSEKKSSVAYWIINSKSPHQKILLLGSDHCKPITSLDNKLVNVLKEGDILIAEVKEERIPTNGKEIIQSLLDHYPLDVLEARGFFSSQKKYIYKSKLLTQILSKAYLRYGEDMKSIVPFLEAAFVEHYSSKSTHPISLDNFSAGFIASILNWSIERTKFINGADSQLIQHFLKKQPASVVGLETYKDREEMGARKIGEEKIHLGKGNYFVRKIEGEIAIDDIKKNFLHLMGISHEFETDHDFETDCGAVDHNEPVPEHVIPRNNLWVKNFEDILEKYNSKKFISMVVGSGHLRGKDNFIQLLEKNGFKVVPALFGKEK